MTEARDIARRKLGAMEGRADHERATLRGSQLWAMVNRAMRGPLPDDDPETMRRAATVARRARRLSRDDREDLRSTIATAILESLDGDPDDWIVARRARIRAQMVDLASATMDSWRRERGMIAALPQPAPGTGASEVLDALLTHGERVLARDAMTTARRSGRAWLAPGDPAPADLRQAIADLPSRVQAAILAGMCPDVPAAEWSEHDPDCPSGDAWRRRVERGRRDLRDRPDIQLAARLALRSILQREDADHEAILERVMASGAIMAPTVAPRPDSGFREHLPEREHAPVRIVQAEQS